MGKVGDLEAEVTRERTAGETARAQLATTEAVLAAESESRAAERIAADRDRTDAAAAVAKLKSDIGNLNERIARSEIEAAENKSAQLREEALNQSLAAELSGERERAASAAEESRRQAGEAARRFNEYKDGADRRHAEVSTRCDEARSSKDAAVKALEAAQLEAAQREKEMANLVSDLRLEAEKAGWALESAKAAAATAHDALERERDAYERKVTEQRAKKTAQKESIETLRSDKDNAEREVLTLSARLEEAKKQAESALNELATFKEGRDRDSQRVDNEVAERQEALRLRSVAETAAVSAREAEKYAREQAAAEAHTAGPWRQKTWGKDGGKKQTNRALDPVDLPTTSTSSRPKSASYSSRFQTLNPYPVRTWNLEPGSVGDGPGCRAFCFQSAAVSPPSPLRRGEGGGAA